MVINLDAIVCRCYALLLVLGSLPVVSYAQSAQDSPASIELKADSASIELKVVEVWASPYLAELSFAGKQTLSTDRPFGATTLAEILQESSGLQISSYGPGGLATLSFMGGGASHAQIYWNGIALNSPALGMFDLNLLSSQGSQGSHESERQTGPQIDIYTGASSLALGAGGLSGGVNVSSKLSRRAGSTSGKPYRYSLTQRIGSFNTYTTAGQVDLTGEKQAFNLAAGFTRSQNNFPINQRTLQQLNPGAKREGAGYQRQFASLGYAYFPDAISSVSFFADYQFMKRDLPAPLFASPQSEQQQDRNLRMALQYERSGKRSSLELQSGYFNETLSYQNEQLTIDNLFHLHTANQQFRYHLLCSPKVKLLFHGDLRYDNYSSPGLTAGTYDLWKAGLSGSLKYKLHPRMELSGLLRNEVRSNRSPVLLPLFEATYSVPAKKISAGLNVARNVRQPSLNDLYWAPGGNPDLEEEESFQLLAQVKKKHHFSRLSLALDGMLWWTELNNQIVWQPGTAGYWSPVNLRDTRHKGGSLDVVLDNLSTSGRKEIGAGKEFNVDKEIYWAAKIGYSYTSATESGEQLAFVPRHKLYLNASSSWKSFTASLNLVASGKRVGNAGELPEWNTVDLSVGYRFGTNLNSNSTSTSTSRAGFIVEAKAANLFNQYYEMVQNRPLPGRNFTVSLKLDFQYD